MITPKKQDLKKLFKQVEDQSKVPLFVTSLSKSLKLEKPLIFVIDSDSSFMYFDKVMRKKLQYMGVLFPSTSSIFFYSKGKQLPVSYTSMGEIFDRYKSESGWLEIQIVADNSF